MNRTIALLVLAAGMTASAASANLINFTNLDRGDVKSNITFPTYGAFDVHMGYRFNYSGGTGILAAYNGNDIITFCGDLQNAVVNSSATFTLSAVTSAPAGGFPNYGGTYSAAQADRLNAWMIASNLLGLVDGRGYFNNTSHTIGATIYSANDVARAIQFGVWNSLFDGPDANTWGYNTGTLKLNNTGAYPLTTAVINCISDISATASLHLGAPMITQMLTNDTYQDMVVLVPTPGAAAILGLGGLMASRRRRPAAV